MMINIAPTIKSIDEIKNIELKKTFFIKRYDATPITAVGINEIDMFSIYCLFCIIFWKYRTITAKIAPDCITTSKSGVIPLF